MSSEGKRRTVTALGLPRDVVLKDVLVDFVGCYEVHIENYRSILIYTDTLIRLQTKNGRLKIRGSRLCIERYTADEMKITGKIDGLDFET